MPVAIERKKKIISEYLRHKKDTGSPQIQVALLTERINNLSMHLKTNAKDTHSRYGLIKMVSQRKRLLRYLRQTDPKGYQELITRLDLRE